MPGGAMPSGASHGSPESARTPARVIALALFMNLLWGGNLPAVKLGLQAVPPLWSGFFRFALGCTALACWAALRGHSLRPRREDWPDFLALGALFTTQIVVMNYGTSFTAASVATVLQSTNPVFASLLAHFLIANDRLSAQRAAGQVLAFGGVCVMVFSRPGSGADAPAPLLGNLLVLASGAMLGSRLVFSTRILQRVETTKMVFWQMALSMPVFLAGGLLFETLDPTQFQPAPLLAIAYQGLAIAGLGFMISASLLRRYRPSLITSFNFTAPIFGVLISRTVLGEVPSPWLLAGLATVAAGLFVITTSR